MTVGYKKYMISINNFYTKEAVKRQLILPCIPQGASEINNIVARRSELRACSKIISKVLS